jgi:hypothetical protein
MSITTDGLATVETIGATGVADIERALRLTAKLDRETAECVLTDRVAARTTKERLARSFFDSASRSEQLARTIEQGDVLIVAAWRTT